MIKLLPIVLLLGCAQPPTSWVVLNATAAQEAEAFKVLSSARVVTRDPHDALARGGSIWIEQKHYGLDGECPVPAGMHVGGCSWSMPSSRSAVEVVADPGPLIPLLAHELCHVALGETNGVDVDGCAAAVLQEYNQQ